LSGELGVNCGTGLETKLAVGVAAGGDSIPQPAITTDSIVSMLTAMSLNTWDTHLFPIKLKEIIADELPWTKIEVIDSPHQFGVKLRDINKGVENWIQARPPN